MNQAIYLSKVLNMVETSMRKAPYPDPIESQKIGKQIMDGFHKHKAEEFAEACGIKKVDTICEFCSDPIMEGAGRQYRGGFYYHDDAESNCFLEAVKLKARSPEVILKAAESMSFDKRVVA